MDRADFLMSHDRVIAVIPALNESATIADVVRVLCASPLVHRVVVVSDGSTDETVVRAREAGARVIDLKTNIGKGGAQQKGVYQECADIYLFLDGDLVGLTTEHIEKILHPVLNGTRMMNVGIRDHGVFWNMVTKWLPLVSGQRAVRREVVEAVPEPFYRGYMIEAALNYVCRSKHFSYGSVPLSGLLVRRKYDKVSFLRAVVQYIAMIAEVVLAMIRVRCSKFMP